jgi:hypothetical protein
MLPILAQIFSPPIINIPPPPKPPWYESPLFIAAISLCAAWFIAGVGMTAKNVIAHVFFIASWVCGSFSLWILCRNVFQKRKLIWWILMALVLAVGIGATDFIRVRP